MKEQFRKDILKEVEEYIGYVYSDDTHFEDKLIVKEFDYSVSHGRRSYKEQEKEYDYFDMSDLIKKSGTFTFEADPIGIECVGDLDHVLEPRLHDLFVPEREARLRPVLVAAYKHTLIKCYYLSLDPLNML